MRLIYPDLVLTLIAGAASAQGSWQPQASSSPTPPVYVAPPASASSRVGQERPAIPASDPRGWITPQDYPVLALRDGRGGLVGFNVAVNADGSVKSCSITASSGSPDLDEATCKVIRQKAIFHPALDARGVQIAGTYSGRALWKGGFEPQHFESNLVRQVEPKERVLTYFVEIDGTIRNCIERQNGRPVPANLTWSLCAFDGKTKPYLDSSGNPVRKFVTQRLVITVEDAPMPPKSKCAQEQRQDCGR
jgi:TonB family protein